MKNQRNTEEIVNCYSVLSRDEFLSMRQVGSTGLVAKEPDALCTIYILRRAAFISMEIHIFTSFVALFRTPLLFLFIFKCCPMNASEYKMSSRRMRESARAGASTSITQSTVCCDLSARAMDSFELLCCEAERRKRSKIDFNVSEPQIWIKRMNNI